MYSEAFNYTVEYATVDGQLMGLTWQAAPGCFIYRNDIADDVLGAHDEATVQEAVKDWDAFLATADKMKEKNYKMLSGPDDVKYVYLDQRTSPWVVDDKLNIDSAVTDYLEMAKKLYDGDYTNKTGMWNDDWNANFSGDVFGYFGCTWFVYWCIPSDSKFYGNCSMVQGPKSYHWGGTYLGVTKDCPNKPLAALVMYTLCCDKDAMAKLSEETLDFVNNKAAMQSLIDAGKGASEVLGGQNPLSIWYEAAQGISLKNATEYDSTINGFLDTASQAYNSGEVKSVDDAVANIKSDVQNAYSFITVE
jgi:ABC-type glycerol-3-phosphate transport system substrate-binding protein